MRVLLFLLTSLQPPQPFFLRRSPLVCEAAADVRNPPAERPVSFGPCAPAQDYEGLLSTAGSYLKMLQPLVDLGLKLTVFNRHDRDLLESTRQILDNTVQDVQRVEDELRRAVDRGKQSGRGGGAPRPERGVQGWSTTSRGPLPFVAGALPLALAEDSRGTRAWDSEARAPRESSAEIVPGSSFRGSGSGETMKSSSPNSGLEGSSPKFGEEDATTLATLFVDIGFADLPGPIGTAELRAVVRKNVVEQSPRSKPSEDEDNNLNKNSPLICLEVVVRPDNDMLVRSVLTSVNAKGRVVASGAVLGATVAGVGAACCACSIKRNWRLEKRLRKLESCVVWQERVLAGKDVGCFLKPVDLPSPDEDLQGRRGSVSTNSEAVAAGGAGVGDDLDLRRPLLDKGRRGE